MPEAIVKPTAPVVEPTAPVITNKPWFEGADTETVGYLQNRGLDKLTPQEAALKTVAAHRAAEAKLGVPADQLVRLPKDSADVEGRKALWTKLGRPSEAKDYELGAVPNVDVAFQEFFAPAAHELGLTKEQAQGVARLLAEKTGAITAEETAAYETQTQVEKDEVLKNWGQHASANALVVQKAFDKLGFSPEQIGGLVNLLGYKSTMDKFLEIGSKLGEDVFVQNQLPGGGNTRYTKEGAVERISQLRNDDAWSKAYLNGDAVKRQEMDALHVIAYG
jgi:hypothetical protein